MYEPDRNPSIKGVKRSAGTPSWFSVCAWFPSLPSGPRDDSCGPSAGAGLRFQPGIFSHSFDSDDCFTRGDSNEIECGGGNHRGHGKRRLQSFPWSFGRVLGARENSRFRYPPVQRLSRAWLLFRSRTGGAGFYGRPPCLCPLSKVGGLIIFIGMARLFRNALSFVMGKELFRDFLASNLTWRRHIG